MCEGSVRPMLREIPGEGPSPAFTGVSGGRAAHAAQLESLGTAGGSGKQRDSDARLTASSDHDFVNGRRTETREPLLSKIQEEENEKPGDGDIEFDASRFGLPSPSVLFSLLEWVTPE